MLFRSQQQQPISFDGVDMQRFQQQLQAAQQYRQQQQQQQQQQQHYAGTSASSNAMVGGMSMMQQQQQQHLGMNNPSAITGMMPPGMGQLSNNNMHGMNHNNMTASNSMIGNMSQLSSSNNMNHSNNNNNNAFGVNWNNSTATSQQNYKVAPHDVYNNNNNSFDTSGHGNQRLMTMSGLGSGVGKSNHPYGASTAGGMSGIMGSHDPNVNSVLVNTENSSTALQNMQLMLLKQQQQQQGLVNYRNNAHRATQRPTIHVIRHTNHIQFVATIFSKIGNTHHHICKQYHGNNGGDQWGGQ